MRCVNLSPWFKALAFNAGNMVRTTNTPYPIIPYTQKYNVYSVYTVYIHFFHSRHSEASNLHGRAGGSCPEADHYSCCCSLAPQKGLHEHGPKNAKAHDQSAGNLHSRDSAYGGLLTSKRKLAAAVQAKRLLSQKKPFHMCHLTFHSRHLAWIEFLFHSLIVEQLLFSELHLVLAKLLSQR